MFVKRKTMMSVLAAALAVAVCTAPAPARAESVAEQLINVLEANGQLTPEQAIRMRDQAAVEREELKREVMDEVRIAADQVHSPNSRFADVATTERTVVHADLATSMKIGGYVQFLASFSDNDGTSAANGNRSSMASAFETTDYRTTDGFSIRRARVKISGNIGPRTKYVIGFDGDNIDDPGIDDAVNFNDVYLEYMPPFLDDTGLDGTVIRAGQFYVPFSREAQFSSTKRLPISRSHFVNELAPFREPGVMIYNKSLVDRRLALYAGVFNGTGENEDDNAQFLWAGRAEFLVMRGRETGLGEADWSIGGAVAGSRDGNGRGGGGAFDIVDPVFINGQDGEIQYIGNRILLTADSQLDVGPFGLNAEFIWGRYDPRSGFAGPVTPGSGGHEVEANGPGGDDDVKLIADEEFWGVHVMPSYWIIADRLQAYVKVEYLEYGNVLDASMWSSTVGLNYHMLSKHRSVLRANWVHLEHESDVVGANALAGLDDDLVQDFFLFEWQVKI